VKVTHWTPEVFDSMSVVNFHEWCDAFTELNRLQEEAMKKDQ
jgi:hypothetical protein